MKLIYVLDCINHSPPAKHVHLIDDDFVIIKQLSSTKPIRELKDFNEYWIKSWIDSFFVHVGNPSSNTLLIF